MCLTWYRKLHNLSTLVGACAGWRAIDAFVPICRVVEFEWSFCVLFIVLLESAFYICLGSQRHKALLLPVPSPLPSQLPWASLATCSSFPAKLSPLHCTGGKAHLRAVPETFAE